MAMLNNQRVSNTKSGWKILERVAVATIVLMCFALYMLHA